MAGQEPQALMQSLIENMFAVFGAPDDPEVARRADDVLADLHAALSEAGARG